MASPVKTTLFSAREYDISSFSAQIKPGLEFSFVPEPLSPSSAGKAAGSTAVCAFVNDDLSKDTLVKLAAEGVRIIALRCAGFNNVDLKAASELGLKVVRVPAYSPAAVAEHAVALMMALNRNLKKSTDRSRHLNFELSGLVGHDIRSRTVGVVGTGKIGMAFLRILNGFGSKLLAHDIYESPEAKAMGVEYVGLDELLSRCDIISLHTNLSPETTHMFDARAFGLMKRGSMLLNTSRGGLIDTRAAIDALKSGQLGHLGIDVVEDEGAVFFHYAKAADVSDEICRLLCMNNVIVTGHQAFLTYEALENIATATVSNIETVLAGKQCANEVTDAPISATAPVSTAGGSASAPK